MKTLVTPRRQTYCRLPLIKERSHAMMSDKMLALSCSAFRLPRLCPFPDEGWTRTGMAVWTCGDIWRRFGDIITVVKYHPFSRGESLGQRE